MALSASHWQTQCYRQNNDSDTENLLYTEDVSEKKNHSGNTNQVRAQP